jgi:hypothetical protein
MVVRRILGRRLIASHRPAVAPSRRSGAPCHSVLSAHLSPSHLLVGQVPDGSGYPPGGAPCTSGYSSTGERFSVKLSLLWERIVARSHRRWMVHVGTRKPTGSLVAVQERSPTEQAVRTHEVALLYRRRWAMRALRHRCGFYPSRKQRKEAAGLAGRGAVATTRRTGAPSMPMMGRAEMES